MHLCGRLPPRRSVGRSVGHGRMEHSRLAPGASTAPPRMCGDTAGPLKIFKFAGCATTPDPNGRSMSCNNATPACVHAGAHRGWHPNCMPGTCWLDARGKLHTSCVADPQACMPTLHLCPRHTREVRDLEDCVGHSLAGLGSYVPGHCAHRADAVAACVEGQQRGAARQAAEWSSRSGSSATGEAGGGGSSFSPGAAVPTAAAAPPPAAPSSVREGTPPAGLAGV